MIYLLKSDLESKNKKMRQINNFLIITAALILDIAILNAQETVSSAGGNASGRAGSVSYTIGQLVFSYYSGTNGSIVQGVQQPYEISVLTSVEDPEIKTIDCIVYPNPASDIIKLSISTPDLSNMHFRLYDVKGVLLQEMKVDNEETEISLSRLAPSTYILRVLRNMKELKTFKIIKN